MLSSESFQTAATSFEQLQLSTEQRMRLEQSVISLIHRFEEENAQYPACHPAPEQHDIDAWLTAPGEHGIADCTQKLDQLMSTLLACTRTGINTGSAGFLSYIPTGGLYTSALGRYLAAAFNRYSGMATPAPGTVALEQSVINWMTELFALGPTAGGVLLSGGSMANFSAVLAARQQMGRSFCNATVYVSASAHHSIVKACRMAGLHASHIRKINTDTQQRMDTACLESTMASDIRAGLRPMMIAATAGTTDAGAIDPLSECADIARHFRTWYHVDAAYGGFFRLTDRGSTRLQGIERADSITADAHKSLFLPLGCAALLVADKNTLRQAHAGSGSYLQDAEEQDSLPDFCSLGPELSRPARGLDIWLPLQVHGVAAFRQELDRMLDLASSAAAGLREIPGISLLTDPALSVVCFRADAGDAATQQIQQQINAAGEIHISSTQVDGKLTLRAAFLSQRCSPDVAEQLVRLVARAMDQINADTCYSRIRPCS